MNDDQTYILLECEFVHMFYGHYTIHNLDSINLSSSFIIATQTVALFHIHVRVLINHSQLKLALLLLLYKDIRDRIQ